ncbi:hypothetical protein [Rhizobium sp. BE258]|uniref:hypothetical protein n=1 Tax=Rhizobium sp. BE258 TaxID=2817722 RepID=UPI00285494B9|nr:hypothetical protein [Rhizobium sp. BE258]MDR7145140.1 hypothetical protein [Rhizobium sp. BE258]
MEKNAVKTKTKILIIGHGVLGGDVLDFLLQSGVSAEIVVGARNPEKALHRVNLARYTAMNLGFSPPVEIVPINLMNIEATAERLVQVKPDIIFNATTLHSWWVITGLPVDAYKRIDAARGGIWTPMHQVLIRRLMKAVRLANSSATVVNASYPDVVNASLAAEGLAPAVGIGNIANAVPGIRLAAAHMLALPPSSIDVRFFAHHYLSYRMPSTGGTDGAPYHLTIYANGLEVPREKIDHETLFSLVAGRFRRVKGLAGQSVTASSATAMLLAIARRAGDVVHAPGPLGLVGGYPVRVSQHGLLVDLPAKLTLDAAIAINRECQRYDGIENVDDDGTVRFTDAAAGVLHEVLGYDLRAYRPDECEARAEELAAHFANFARKNGMPDAKAS